MRLRGIVIYIYIGVYASVHTYAYTYIYVYSYIYIYIYTCMLVSCTLSTWTPVNIRDFCFECADAFSPVAPSLDPYSANVAMPSDGHPSVFWMQLHTAGRPRDWYAAAHKMWHWASWPIFLKNSSSESKKIMIHFTVLLFAQLGLCHWDSNEIRHVSLACSGLP